MSTDPTRRSNRVSFHAKALIRGACGTFESCVEDISLTGVRLRIVRAEMNLSDDVDMATAAASVQTRIGSRFVVELGITRGARRLRKQLNLIRLVLPGQQPDSLDLGCVFEEPLSSSEMEGLNIALSETSQEVEEVRHVEPWDKTDRPPLDPKVTEEKVVALFGVTADHTPPPDEVQPERPLRVILASSQSGGAPPLVCSVETLTQTTILIRIDGDSVRHWGAQIGDLGGVSGHVVNEYGSWPVLELVDGAQRLWQGSAHFYGVEVGDGPVHDVFLRMAFSPRLGRSEFARICAA